MHTRVAALLFLVATNASAIVLGPEVQVAQPLLGVANGAQLSAVIASGGNDSLVAWFDYDRSGVYVTTIALDGTVATPARRIYSGFASGISLCWTGAAYLATWYDYPTGLLAMPLGRDGAPTGAARLVGPVETITHTGALAWNGHHAFLAYYTANGASAVILDAQANVIRSDVVLPKTSSQQSVVVAAGSTFDVFTRAPVLVPVSSGAYKNAEVITLVRFADDGTPYDPAPTVVSLTDPIANSWGVASDGNRLALVVVEQPSQSAPALRRYLIDPQTRVSQALPALGVNAPSGAVVTWNGSMFIAVWSDYGQGSTSALMTVPFSDGTDAGPAAFLSLDGAATNAIATFNGRNVVAAWLDRTDGISDVSGVLLDTTATRTAGQRFTISTGNQWQVSPVLAPSLAVWVETAGDSANDVFAARATGTGFGPRIRVSASSQATDSRPAVAFTGDTYLVVWQERSPDAFSTRLMARRLRLDGTPLDAQPILVSDRASDPSVAFNGSTILLAYTFGDLTFGGSDSTFIVGVRFDRSGKRVDTAPVVLSGVGGAHGASVASNGSDFLVVWRHAPAFFCCSDPLPPPAPPPPSPPPPEVLGVRVTAAGDVLDPAPLTIASPADGGTSPVAAWSGGAYLIAFVRTDAAATVLAQRLLSGGPLSGQPLALGAAGDGVSFSMAIAADATGCWISWSDADVHLAHVSESGVDVEPAVIATGAVQPALVLGSIAYTRTDPDRTVVTRVLPAHARRRTAGR